MQEYFQNDIFRSSSYDLLLLVAGINTNYDNYFNSNEYNSLSLYG